MNPAAEQKAMHDSSVIPVVLVYVASVRVRPPLTLSLKSTQAYQQPVESKEG
jgi:hypothetical protein